MVLFAKDINTVHTTGMQLTKMPVEILVRAPAMRDGGTRGEALRAKSLGPIETREVLGVGSVEEKWGLTSYNRLLTSSYS